MYDFNVLEWRAKKLIAAGRPKDAMAIPHSIRATWPRVSENAVSCWETRTQRSGYGRAVEEDPEIPAYTQARQKLEHITIDDFLLPPG